MIEIEKLSKNPLQETSWQDLNLTLVGEYLAQYRSLKMEDYSPAEQQTFLST